jgi:Leucine-rich repeat (LRR) protein
MKAMFQALPPLKSLEALFLSKNKIKFCDGAHRQEIIAVVAQMTALQTLWLDKNEVSDDDKTAIKASLTSQMSGLRM